jgi:surface rod structure-forming protein G
MTAGTSALLLAVGGGVAGVAAWTGDGPTVATAGPDQLPVPGGIGDGAAAPRISPPADGADQPIPADLRRAPGVGAGIDPATTAARSGGLAVGLNPAAAAESSTPKITKTPTTTGTPSSVPPRPPQPTRPPRTTQPTRPPQGSLPATPVITTRIEVETRSIPFRARVIRDPALPRGTKDVQAEGAPGVRSLRYLITLTDGRRTGRRLLDTTVTKRPEQRVIAIGVGPDQDQDSDQGGDDIGDDRWDCAPGGPDDLCLPFGRSAATCAESDEPGEHDSGGSGAGMIVLGDPVIDDEDIGLPDGYGWTC